MMQEDDDENGSQTDFSTAIPVCCFPKKNRGFSGKTLVHFQNQKQCEYNRKSCHESFPDSFSSTSKTEPLFFPKTISRVAIATEDLTGSKFFPEDVSRQKKVRTELVELFKEDVADENSEDKTKNRKQGKMEGSIDGLSYTKEFHILTEVQKERILTVVEDAIKKLANSDCRNFCNENPEECLRSQSFVSQNVNLPKCLSKKFFLPWAIMKILEMVICNIIQLTFLSNELYFQKKKEFIPVVATYYFTLFIIVVSLLVHICCYAYTGFKHPCYFMSVASSSILTLTTVLGILIMLCSMEYYKSFKEILVIVFIGGLLCMLAVELCICYLEVKDIWNKVQTPEHYYVC